MKTPSRMSPPPQKDMTAQAWANLAALSAIWGCVFLAVRIALDEIGPFTAVAFRIALAAPVLWIVVAWMGLEVPRGWRVWGAFGVMGLLNNVVPFTLQAWGQIHIESGLVAIFNAMTAIFGVLVAAIFLADERLTPRKLIGTALGLAGVITAIGLSSLGNLDLRSLAQLAVLLSTVCYAFAGVWARRHLGHLSPHMAAAGMLTASSVMIVPLAFAVEGLPSLSYAADTWAAIAFYSVVATAGAYLLYYRVLALAGSGNLMLCTLLIAPIAIVLGAVVRGEVLPPQAYTGFAILAVGLLVIDGRIFRRRTPSRAG